MLPGKTWEPYRRVPASVSYNPFKRGAQAAVLFENLERELHRAVDYAALFRFENAEKLRRYWNVRAGDVSTRAPWSYEPYSDGRPGRDEWRYGEYLCYVNDGGYASLRWTDERTNTYGVLNLVDGKKSLKAVFRQWKRVR